ncbi:MAG TPA: NAD-binding protein [Saprospiraceae bacterium]|nr:NAD-binding protein [Saprospiraceae bacterium]
MGTLRKYNWLLPLLILFALLLGAVGFYQYGIMQNAPNNWTASLYLSLQLFVLNSGGVPGPVPITLDIARFLAPALTAGSIFLAIWWPLHQNYLLFKIRFWKHHIVVCGLSKKAELLILDFLAQKGKNARIVLIESNDAHGSISFMRKKGVIVLPGNATDEEMLLKANLYNAKFLLALTNDEKTNIHIAQKATHLYNLAPDKILPDTTLQIILHIDDFYTMNIFKEFHEKAVPDEKQFRIHGSKIDYHVFSIYQLAAIFMIDNFSPDQYVSLESRNDPPAHILILGDNLAAQYLILEAAQMFHFANLKKTRITVVADDVKDIELKIESLYPFLDETVELQYVPTGIFFSDQCPTVCDELSVCYVALDDDGKSVYFSRKLRQFIFTQGSQMRKDNESSFSKSQNFESGAPPIKVLIPRNTALVNIFKDVVTEMKSLNIELLNLDEEICNKKTIVDNRKEEDFIAKHIHYEWAKNNAEKTSTAIGSMRDEWDKLKDAQKDSNRLPARHLHIKLRFVKAELTDSQEGEELDFTTIADTAWDSIARMEHNRWNAEKFIKGYRRIDPPQDRQLGRFLNENLKLHWDLVPYDQLPPEIQEYDTFTFRMAPVIAKLNHKRIVRKP